MSKFKVGQIWADRKGRKWTIFEIDGDVYNPYPIYAKPSDSDKFMVYTLEGNTYSDGREYPWDLITLIKDVEGNVTKLKFKVGDRVKHYFDDCLGTVEHVRSDRFHLYIVMWDNCERNAYTESELVLAKEETVSNKLPSEPVAGQYYRTKDGFKLLFIGKGKDYFYYESRPENGALCFVYPYQYHKNGSHDYDIVAPWTEPLPAMEIKRWAIVAKIDVTDNNGDLLKRGEHIFGYDSEDDAKNHLIGWSNKDWYEIVELTGTLPATEQV
jgi:hypothetical protein